MHRPLAGLPMLHSICWHESIADLLMVQSKTMHNSLADSSTVQGKKMHMPLAGLSTLPGETATDWHFNTEFEFKPIRCFLELSASFSRWNKYLAKFVNSPVQASEQAPGKGGCIPDPWQQRHRKRACFSRPAASEHRQPALPGTGHLANG